MIKQVQSRVQEALQLCTDLIDVRESSEQVVAAMACGDFEAAARCIAKYRSLQGIYLLISSQTFFYFDEHFFNSDVT